MPQPVTVTIANDVISVDPQTVLAGNGRNVPINWRITDSPGWNFTGTGIVIKNDDGQFSDPRGGGTDTFHWLDRNSNSNLYPYTVNVTDGQKTLTLDPAIQNQGS